ncbi:uncharacterized protein ARMOST_06214 [Armillaria ostoyae]|uniref:Uncharacterized protein n=1 Tax=Armillaria ostoyae TaxID=47428 RepID=A0A284R2D7_ARMOS|nr:uncharacterized protein ARMOST_06214 [Armillaria ostoyae]
MDPVSLLTGIPDLIERCIKGYNFLKDVKNAPKACSELMEELKLAQARLEQLREHLNRVEDKEKAQLSLQNYEKILDKLDSILKVYDDPKFKFSLVKRVKWVWSGEKKFKTLCDDLKQNSGILQPLLVKMAKDIDDMKRCQQEADTKIDDMNRRQREVDAKKVADELAKRLQEVVKWLEPLHSEVKLREVHERRQPGTCKWLLSRVLFASWYSSGSFLWLNGIPGNGKTILASFVIDHLKNSVMSDEIVLFAFADFQDVRSTDVVVLLRTLLAQLLNHCKPEDIVNDHDFAQLEKTMQEYPADLPKSLGYLVELLGKASAPWKRVFIIIDALDEFAQTGRRESIAAIRNLVSAGSKISIFVTSRAEQDIVDVLRSVPTISLVDETWGVKDDIGRFIEEKMNTTYLPLARLHEPVRTRITSTLLEKANGMQLRSLAKAKLERDIDYILQNLPADLNSMYERILQSVEAEGQHIVKIVQRTLWWLVGSQRQLRLAELMEAVMVETGRDSPNTDLKPLSDEHLLEMCSSLVHHNAETDVLVLSHASVQDFLFSDYLKGTVHQHHHYHIPSFSFLHRHITGLISTYLHYEDFQNGPCRTLQLLLERLEKHPFLVYVASSWHLHIVKMYETWSRESEEDPPDIDTVFSLFDDSEENLLAQCSRRQVSYFVKDRRDALKHDSWGEDFGDSSVLEPEERTLNVFSSPLHESETGDVPYYGINVSDNYGWRDLSNTTPLELDCMVYPLVSEGSPSLVRDLLCKLPKFKDRPVCYFGTPLMISIFAGKLDTVKMLLQDLRVNVNTRARHHRCNDQVVSPIFIATRYGHVEVVEQLLDCGSATGFHPGRRLEWLPGQEPEDAAAHNDIIIGAVYYGHADILKVLIHHGLM